MPYGLPYNSPGFLPGVILLISLILTVLKHAERICQKRLQQKDVAVSEESSGSLHPCARSQGENSLFRPDRRNNVQRLTATEHCGRTGGDSSYSNQGTNCQDFKKDGKGLPNDTQQSSSKVPQPAHPSDDNVKIPTRPSHDRVMQSRRSTGDVRSGVPCCSMSRQNPEGSQSRTNRKAEQIARGSQGNQSDRSHLQSDSVESVQRSQATQVYLKTKTVSTCSNYIIDKPDTEQFIYKVLQQVVQQTQKHMYDHLQQSMQQTYSGLTLGTPVHAKEFVSKFMDTEETLILTKNRQPTVTQSDDTTYDDWNADSWDDSTTIMADSTNGDEAAHTEVKQLAGAETPGPSCPSGGARQKTGFPANPNWPSATIAGTPAGFEDFEDYFNPQIVSSLPLFAMSPSFAVAVNLCSCPLVNREECMAAQDCGIIDRMAERLDPKKHSVQEPSGKCNAISQTIKTRNNPRSVYVSDFQRLSQSHNVNVHRDVYQTLDLAMAFKGLTVVMLSDPPQETQISNQKSEWPFGYSSPSPSPTSMEKEQSLEAVDDIPIPLDIIEDKVFVQDDIW